eukprot:TRINITY_DN118_c0_g1_i2.p1 TRINITY_DN118_c0_g1~~TRINITY_DN118_c0_g1_i2.p1  ORF type:complete len:238 (-),score=41.95 TRINITY_DN118_c0_g1_i2:205-918(-)
MTTDMSVASSSSSSATAQNTVPIKPPKVRGSCFLYFCIVLVRFYCLIAGIVELGYGGWCLYQIYADEKQFRRGPIDKIFVPALLQAVIGLFLILVGLCIVAGELRTRWTTTRAIKVIVFLGSYMGRGVFYLCVAMLNMPISVEVYSTKFQGKPFVVAGQLIAVVLALAGLLSILMHPFVWQLERKRTISTLTWFEEQKNAGVDTNELKSIMVDPNNFNSGRTMYDTRMAMLEGAPDS